MVASMVRWVRSLDAGGLLLAAVMLGVPTLGSGCAGDADGEGSSNGTAITSATGAEVGSDAGDAPGEGGPSGSGATATASGSGGDADTGGEGGNAAGCATAPEPTGNYQVYEMRDPAGLDRTKPTPLVVFWGGSLAYLGPPFNLEDQIGVTPVASERGYILAYASSPDNPQDTDPAMNTLRTIINNEDYCFDPKRIYLMGNSQGAITAQLHTIFNEEDPKVAAIAIHAGSAGVVLGAGDTCPTMMPVSTFIMHPENDHLFGAQGGRGYRDYMVSCGGCSTTGQPGPAPGCETYPGCQDIDVTYCEHAMGHEHWPTEWLPAAFDFLAAHSR